MGAISDDLWLLKIFFDSEKTKIATILGDLWLLEPLFDRNRRICDLFGIKFVSKCRLGDRKYPDGGYMGRSGIKNVTKS